MDAVVERIGAVWDQHHASGHFATHYPFDDVIAFVYRYRGRAAREGAPIRALDLGCGAGNNLSFLAEQGLVATGIDISATAVARARELAERRGQSFEVVQGSMTELPFHEASFDLVVDRKGLTVLPPKAAVVAIQEVARVLRPGGYFLFTPMSDQDSRFLSGPAEGGYVGPQPQFSATTGIVHRGSAFWSMSAIRAALDGCFAIEELVHCTQVGMQRAERTVVAEWRVVAKRV